MTLGPTDSANNPIHAAESPPAAALPYAAGAGQILDPSERNAKASRYDVAVVALRLLAIYILLQGAAGLGWAIVSLMEVLRYPRGFGLTSLVGLLPTAICVAAGVVLWKVGPGVAARMLPRAAGDTEAATGSVPLQSIAFSVAGVLLVANAVPEFFYRLAATTHSIGDVYSVSQRTDDFIRALTDPALRAVAGAWLFFGSKRLAAYWHRLRQPEHRGGGDATG
jgi:hypothetical protein